MDRKQVAAASHHWLAGSCRPTSSLVDAAPVPDVEDEHDQAIAVDLIEDGQSPTRTRQVRGSVVSCVACPGVGFSANRSIAASTRR